MAKKAVDTIKETLELIPLMKSKFGITRNRDSCDELLYTGVAQSDVIDELSQEVAKYFGSPYKAKGDGAFWANWFDSFVKSVGGIESDQTLYKKEISETVTMYCAFWPWGSNPVKTSVRIGVLCSDDKERSGLAKELKGSF